MAVVLKTTRALTRPRGFESHTLRFRSIHSCPQKAWPARRRTVAEVVSPPDELMLACGMLIAFGDPAAVHVRIDRARLAETVTFLD
jgi:hypothetical protein